MSVHPTEGARPAGVIHDLGYRPYDGARRSESAIGAALFSTGFKNAFGIGRSGKSKVLPFLLLALNLTPAIVMVGFLVLLREQFSLKGELPIKYAQYASLTQILASIFVAAQAPVLFSRDLRHGTIVLYLARPLSSARYALARWAATFAAMLVFLATPILVLYLGALLLELDPWDQTTEAAIALGLAVLLAAALASVAGLVSSISIRRGFAVVASIAVLLLSNGFVLVIQAIAEAQSQPWIGEVAGLFSPYTIYRGVANAAADVPTITPPDGAAMQAAYFAALVGVAVVGLGLILLRYRKVAGR